MKNKLFDDKSMKMCYVISMVEVNRYEIQAISLKVDSMLVPASPAGANRYEKQAI